MDNPISPISRTLYPSENTKTPTPLRIGDTIRAVVQDRISDDTVLFQYGNSVIQAKTDLPLYAGQVLFLRVNTLGSEIQLQIMATPEDAGVTITDALWSVLAELKNNTAAAANLTKLADLLNRVPIELKNQIPELAVLEKLLLRVDALTGDALEQAVADSGVLFETKLRILAKHAGTDDARATQGALIPGYDLKGVLLRLKDLLVNSDVADRLRAAGTMPEQLGHTVEKLLGNIEFLQVQSKLGESLQVFLPLFWKELKEEQLTFKKTDKGRESPSYSCTINLEFERIGKLRSQVLFQSGLIHVKLISDKASFANTLQDHAEVLGKQFETAGLKSGRLSIAFKRDLDFSQELPEGLDIRV
jgi:hypothetical protein